MSLLGVDVGTTGCKAVAFNAAGDILAYAYREYDTSIPHPGWVEQDSLEILARVEEVIARCAEETSPDPISAIGFSAQGGASAAIDLEGRPLTPLINTSDNRTADIEREWFEMASADEIYAITGAPASAGRHMQRMLWFARHRPEIFERTYKFVSAVDLVTTHLGAPPTIDWTMAGATLLFDIHKRDWSDVLLRRAGFDRSLLSDLAEPGVVIGQVSPAVARRTGLPAGVKLVAGGQDQQVGAFGAGLLGPGDATDSLGTVDCIATAFTDPQLGPDFQRYSCFNLAHSYNRLWTFMAFNNGFGVVIRWYIRTFEGDEAPPDQARYDELFAGLMDEGPSPALVLPHHRGSASPTYDLKSRGAIVGLRVDTGRREILKGLLDCQNYEIRLNLDIWDELNIGVKRLRAFGGGARSDVMLQIKADVLGLEIAQLDCPEVGCLGAAALAGMGTGQIDSPEDYLATAAGEKRVFEPRSMWREAYRERYEIYKELYPALKLINARLP